MQPKWYSNKSVKSVTWLQNCFDTTFLVTLYLPEASNTEITATLPKESMNLAVYNMRYKSRFVRGLNLLQSIQNHSVPSLFGSKIMNAAHSVWAGSMTICPSILSISAFSKPLILEPVLYGTELTSCVLSSRSSVRCYSTLMQPWRQSQIDWNLESMSTNSTQYCEFLSDNFTLYRPSCKVCEKASLRAVCRKIWESRDAAAL